MAVREEVDNTGMRPKVGDYTLTLPITFDYSGGRRNRNKTTRIWAAILGVLSVIIGVGILFRSNSNIFINILTCVVVVYVFWFVIRFFLLKEGIYRNEKIRLMDADNLIPLTEIWGIYDISDMYPYVCRFRNGRSGMFVLLHKDVILGKYAESEYEHYEAIGDAYNICGSSNIQMCYIDYMDLIGSDDRLDESFKNLDRVYNRDLRDILTDIYTYQKEVMSNQATTFDCYLFLWSGNDDSSWSTIQRILSCFLDANYRGYRILNKSDIRDLTKVVFNLEDFSVENGMLNAFDVKDEIRGVTPIKVIHADGSEEVLNKTSAERKEERENREREAELRKEELKARKEERKRGKKKGKQEDDGESYDIF